MLHQDRGSCSAVGFWPVLPGPRGVQYLSGVGWLCSARYREVRDDAVGPAGPTLFETGMDLSDTTLGSGGEDQVRARARFIRSFTGGGRDRVLARGGDCVSCWGRTFIQDDCTLAPVVCNRTLSSCGKYVPDRNWLSGAWVLARCPVRLGAAVWLRRGLLSGGLPVAA